MWQHKNSRTALNKYYFNTNSLLSHIFIEPLPVKEPIVDIVVGDLISAPKSAIAEFEDETSIVDDTGTLPEVVDTVGLTTPNSGFVGEVVSAEARLKEALP